MAKNGQNAIFAHQFAHQYWCSNFYSKSAWKNQPYGQKQSSSGQFLTKLWQFKFVKNYYYYPFLISKYLFQYSRFSIFYYPISISHCPLSIIRYIFSMFCFPISLFRFPFHIILNALSIIHLPSTIFHIVFSIIQFSLSIINYPFCILHIPFHIVSETVSQSVCQERLPCKNLRSYGHCPKCPPPSPPSYGHFGPFFAKTSKNMGTVQTFMDMGLTPTPKNMDNVHNSFFFLHGSLPFVSQSFIQSPYQPKKCTFWEKSILNTQILMLGFVDQLHKCS